MEHLTAAYDQTVILEDISSGGTRRVFVIVGGSGLRQEHTFEDLIGLMQPLAGKVLIDGDNIIGADESVRIVFFARLALCSDGRPVRVHDPPENVRLALGEFTDVPRRRRFTASMKLTLVD